MATKTKTAVGSANGAAKTVTKRKLTAAPAVERVSKPAAPSKKTMTTQIPQAVIALRAYFIAEARMSTGQSGDSLSDWIEAERQLLAEAGK